MGRHVIMGRKSFESLPGSLDGRTIITITGNREYYDSSCVVKHNLESALLFAKKEREKEVFILGGGEIYAATQGLWDKLYVTEVDAVLNGDTSFVELRIQNWKLESEVHHLADEKNRYNYTFRIYNRIK